MIRATQWKVTASWITTRLPAAFPTVCARRTWSGRTLPKPAPTRCSCTCSARAANPPRASNSICTWTGNRFSKRPDDYSISMQMAERATAFSSLNSLVMKEQAHAHNQFGKIRADGRDVGSLRARGDVCALDRHHDRALVLLSCTRGQL